MEEIPSKKFVVTIIGSLKWADSMQDAKNFYENLGYTVYSPNDPTVQNQPLVIIQSEWIKRIKEADFVVAIPKDPYLKSTNGKTIYTYEFGESSSYELAIANSLGKKVVIWME